MPARRRSLAPLLLAVALLASACGGSAVEALRVTRDDVEVRPTPSPAPIVEHPLTGELAEGEPSWGARSALAVKVENSPVSRPQAGLAAADLVYEELAEGGITRFIAVFHSREAGDVGPVRSARMVDPDVLAPLGGLFAYAGGVPPVVKAVRAVDGLTDVGYDRATSAYWRRKDRKAPHNLFTSTLKLWDDREGQPPARQFVFADEAPAGGEPATTAAFRFSGRGEEIRFVHDAETGGYLRFQGGKPHLLEGGVQAAARNLVIQRVQVTRGSIVDVNGEASPDSRVIGTGELLLLRDGQLYRGTWVRESREGLTTFLDADGNPLALARGATWVELLPSSQTPAVS